MRKLRFLAVALIATFVIAAVAVAQTSTTVYTAGGSVLAHGGTKKKPKPGTLKFTFGVSDSTGIQPAPVQSYSIAFDGGRLNTDIVPACKASAINAANGDDSICKAASKVGTGTLDSLIGTTGQPTALAAPCKTTLKLYGGGKGHLTLMVRSTLASCPTALHQAIDMKYFTKGKYAGLKFTVPPELRHQLGLDITVVNATTTIKKIVKKGKGLVESTGCKGKKRSLQVTFTDEAGANFPVTKSIGAC